MTVEYLTPELSMKKYHKTIDWRKIEQGPAMDDVEDAKKDHKKNNQVITIKI